MHPLTFLPFAIGIVNGHYAHVHRAHKPIDHPVQTSTVAPVITTAPEFEPEKFEKRDSLTTIAVSSCFNYADPSVGDANGCECEGFDGILPHTTVTVGGSTSVGCSGISTVVTIATSNNPYPFTRTFSNSAVIAYETTQAYPDNAWVGAGASTTIKTGKSMSLELNPSASQNIGTLTGEALYTSISSALSVGCGTVAESSTMVSCAVPDITGINYVENGVEGAWNDGSVSVSIPFMSVTDDDTLQALIGSVAGALMASSVIPNSSTLYNTPNFGEVNMTNVAALAQSIWTDDTGDTHSPQSLSVALAFSCPTGCVGSASDSYLCDDESLGSSIATVGGFIADALSLIPGLEWIGEVGEGIEVASKVAGTADGAISVACEIQSLTEG